MKVTVVGGGFAGMSAAVELSRRGARVTLLESRRRLGGRAYSFLDPVTGSVVDNGQHVLMRCCTATLEFLKILGSDSLVTFQETLDLEFLEVPGTARLRAARRLPGRLSLLVGLLRFSSVPWYQGMAVIRIAAALDPPPDDALSVEAWLHSARQPEGLIERFWAPLCISVMNQRPRTASARLFAAVVREAFGATAQDGNLGWATAGLSQLHDPVTAYLQRSQGDVHVGAMARAITPGTRPATELKSGDRIESDAVVVAVPPPSAGRLLSIRDFPDLAARLSQFVPSPIVSVNLWTEHPLVDRPFVGFVTGSFDWVFRRDLLLGKESAGKGYHTCLIASAADHLDNLDNRRIYERALETLADAGLSVGKGEIIHHSVIREPRATYALPLGVSPIDHRTERDGIVLAGDWTNTGFPCTIEGAIRSGRMAADALADR